MKVLVVGVTCRTSWRARASIPKRRACRTPRVGISSERSIKSAKASRASNRARQSPPCQSTVLRTVRVRAPARLVPVPAGLDAAEAVAVVLNYVTAYQMLHRSAKARPGQRMLIHGASGGVGSAMLQLAKLAGVEMYGTCSAQGAAVVRELGGIPIDYKNADFVKEVHRLTGVGLDAVFDGIGGDNLWRSRDALREGGRVVTYGFQSKMRGGRMASGSEGRHPIRESAELGWFIVRNWFKPGRKSMVPYSIQWLMRFKPAWFRHDLLTLLDLLKQGKIKPLIAQRLPLEEARRAQRCWAKAECSGRSCCCRTASGTWRPGVSGKSVRGATSLVKSRVVRRHARAALRLGSLRAAPLNQAIKRRGKVRCGSKRRSS